MRSPVKILVVFLFCAVVGSQPSLAFGQWGEWQPFTDKNGVDIFFRVFEPDKGWALKAQWRAVNNNSHKVWVGLGRKTYTLSSGRSAYGTSEGSDVRANSRYTFVEDIVMLNPDGQRIHHADLAHLEVR